MRVVIMLSPTSYSFLSPNGDRIRMVVIACVEGRTTSIESNILIPFGLSYADTLIAVRDAVFQLAADAGDPIDPGAEVQIYGGPQPTLADLGG